MDIFSGTPAPDSFSVRLSFLSDFLQQLDKRLWDLSLFTSGYIPGYRSAAMQNIVCPCSCQWFRETRHIALSPIFPEKIEQMQLCLARSTLEHILPNAMMSKGGIKVAVHLSGGIIFLLR